MRYCAHPTRKTIFPFRPDSSPISNARRACSIGNTSATMGLMNPLSMRLPISINWIRLAFRREVRGMHSNEFSCSAVAVLRGHAGGLLSYSFLCKARGPVSIRQCRGHVCLCLIYCHQVRGVFRDSSKRVWKRRSNFSNSYSTVLVAIFIGDP